MKSRKNAFFIRFFRPYVKFLLKKHFYRVHINDQAWSSTKGSKLFLPNHSNWWDGLVIFYLNEAVTKQDSYSMMSEDGLKQFPFFGKIGAFPVSDSPKKLLASLKYAIELIKEEKSIWIFPQGKEEHLEKRPFHFMNGPAYLIDKQPGIEVYPIAFYYTFMHDQKPELFIKIGTAVNGEKLAHKEKNQITEELADRLERLVDEVREHAMEGERSHYRILVNGRKTISEWLQWWKQLGGIK
ncbi:1-acyl-sn-glycerol-3-phosphate acyltransferase [Bacillus ectoiniformans]|uniref:lysophospholipid acyltransferase family protein n=1 Tax=Bacillus ectoiniformans TaxID=1494429 RepID=UPI00195CEBF6|nr:lysophospholipid acyltransferase family protein [Bacillus ectoiniformans]MBM7647882.1 1-acyl-sn-glycerol-3-phosphate acyltransferase [Bacillus ectoiniformans]